MPRLVDLTNQTFGTLQPFLIVGKTRFGQMIWRCRCTACGREDVDVVGHLLRTGQTTNCGCTWGARHRKHGMSGTPEYAAYGDAKRRCKKDKNYIGRIEFHFTSFKEFFAEVGLRPSDVYSLDRKNNNGHYEKGNVRWATRTEQNNNQRSVSEMQERINQLEHQLAEARASVSASRHSRHTLPSY